MTSRRLARLVRLKKLVEQTRAAELAERQADLDQARADLGTTESELAELDEQTASGQPTAQDLVDASRYGGQIRKRIARARAVVDERTAEVDTSRDGVREAWRERRLLQGAEERARATEDAAELSDERREYDAIALSIYSRRGGEER